MGFGNLIDSGAQNNLTNIQNSVNSIGGNLQYQAADQEATALQSEATDVFQETQLNAEQATLEYKSAYGQQAESYASSGVELNGSPIDMLHQTLMLGQQQVGAIEEQGRLQQNLLETQANQTQETGLADLLTAEGQNTINSQQNALSQAQQKNQLLMQFLGMGAGFGGGLLDSLVSGASSSIAKSLLGP